MDREQILERGKAAMQRIGHRLDRAAFLVERHAAELDAEVAAEEIEAATRAGRVADFSSYRAAYGED